MRTVIVSTTDNDDYLFFLPVITWAWKRLGWDVKCFYVGEMSDKVSFVYGKAGIGFDMVEIPEGMNPVTVAQMSRLYAWKDFDSNTLLMTSDVDMLPLSDYWKPKDSGINCYGRNLSVEHQPICYVAMSADRWEYIINSDLKTDMELFNNNWTTDQFVLIRALTKISALKDLININREIDPNTGYPLGRIDRSAWNKSLQQTERIDAHLLRPGYTDENWPRIMSLIEECLNPTIDEIEWLNNCKNEYIKQL